MRYPTEEELSYLTTVSTTGSWEVVEYLKQIWQWPEMIQIKGQTVSIATGGWSGNEEIIGSLMDTPFWKLYLIKSTRGGGYTFKLPTRKPEDKLHG